MYFSFRPLILAAGAGLATVLAGVPASADRHCSFARESAFYARELSAEAAQASSGQCDSKVAEALERLNDARIELEICSCTVAETPLRRWLDGQGQAANRKEACGVRAGAINAISKKVLTLVETCF